MNTDFRAWIAFGYAAERGIADLRIFQDGTAPAGEWREAAAEFHESPNPFPRGGAEGGERVLDLVLDGDFIVAAFQQQAYGIDLTDPGLSMHWHRFLALRAVCRRTRRSRALWASADGARTTGARAGRGRCSGGARVGAAADRGAASVRDAGRPARGLYRSPTSAGSLGV